MARKDFLSLMAHRPTRTALSKLTDYCLSPVHPKGRHKARVFASVLGLDGSHAGFLRSALLEAAQDAEAVSSDHDEYGRRYVVDFLLVGPSGPAAPRQDLPPALVPGGIPRGGSVATSVQRIPTAPDCIRQPHGRSLEEPWKESDCPQRPAACHKRAKFRELSDADVERLEDAIRSAVDATTAM